MITNVLQLKNQSPTQGRTSIFKYLSLLAMVLFFGVNGVRGQISITSLPADYSNNFGNYNPSSAGNVPSTINSSGTSTAGLSSATTGWSVSSTSATYNGRGTGSGTTGGFYAYYSGTGTEFSLGALPSGSNTHTYTISFTNNSGSTITSLTMSWDYEQWRYGGSNTSGWDCTGTGQLSANSTLNGKDFSGANSTAGAISGGLTTAISSFTLTGLSIANGQSFGITWVTTNPSGADNGVAIDNFTISASGTVSPTITGAATATAFTTTYGTASAVQTFSVSGSNLTANLVATAPTGFEVSNDGTTYGSTATFTQSSGSASGSLRVRLAANAAVTGTSYNSQNIVLSSTGASSVNIATSASGNAVTAKGLTITGLTAANKVYDGLTTVSVTGTPAYSGLVNSESFSVTGSVTFAFGTASVGNSKSITNTGTYAAPSTNYTVTQPSFTANITAAPLTIIGITANNKVFDGTTSATLSGTAAYSGLVNGETFTVTGTPSATFADASVGTAKPVTVTGYTAPSANYSITQPTGLTADITAASSPIISANGTLLSALSTTYGTASSTTTFSVSGSSLTNDIVITPPSGFEVSTSIGSGYTTSLTLTQSGGSVSTTTVYLRLAATTGFGTYSGNIDVSSTGATSQTVATVSSSVAKKALTITGITVDNKVYDGTTTATTSGTAVYNGLVNSESFTVTDIVSFAFATASVGNGKTINQTGAYTVPSVNYSISQPTLTANITSATPPTITAAVGATVDGSFNVTFVDDALWRSGITGITVGGTTLTAGYTVSSGQIAFNPAASVPAGLLQTAGSKTIVVSSTGYSSNTFTQAIGVGATTKLTNNTSPAAPATNSAVFATQPKVNITDQYGNIITTDNSTVVTVAATQGTWTLGGTLTATAVNGVASFSGLTATSATAVTGATLDYTATGLTGFTSATFNIPAPAPANDLCASATTITVGAGSTSGTMVGATLSSPFSDDNDVWYKFTATCTGTATVTISTTSQDIDLTAWSTSCPAATTGNIGTGGGTSSLTTETLTISATQGTTYYVRAVHYSATSGSVAGSFTIAVASSVNSTLALANTGTPVVGNISSGTSNVTLFGFGLTPSACNNISISSVSITTAGTATSSDLSNFRLLYDANSNGTADAGEISSPIGTVASLSNPLVFAGLAGQTFTASTVRRYLLIADVATSPTGGVTFTGSLTNANVTSTATVSSSATGNAQTIINSTLVLANNTQIGAASIVRGVSNIIIHKASVTVSGSQSAIVSQIRFVTPSAAGGYTNADIASGGFKLWRNTTNDFSTATQVGSGLSSAKVTASSAENLDFTASQTLSTSTTYYYWLTVDLNASATIGRTLVINALAASSITATGSGISGSTTATGTQTIAAPTLTIGENTAVTAANVFVNTNNNIVAKAQLAITNANVAITDISFVTAANVGGYTNADIVSNGFKLWYSTTNTFGTAIQYGSSVSSAKVSANSTETLTFTSSQTLNTGSTYYLWLTADISATATTGRTITVNGISSSSVTSTTVGVNLTGSTAASGIQTIAAPTVTLANTGTPAASNLGIGTSNQILFGFALTPNTSVDFSSVAIQTSGSATSSDLSNFRLIYDANADGAASAGEISASLGTVSAMSSTLTFSGISGQTGFSSVRRYLLIADVSSGATASRTFVGSVSNTDITTTATINTGSATGNTITIIRLVTAGDIAIIGYGSTNPDKFAFLLINDLPANTVLYFTDNAWTGSALATNEGTITWTSPNSTLSAGTVVTCSSVTSPTFSSGSGTLTNSVAFASGGDQVLCYRGTGVGSASEFIAGFSASQWITTGSTGTGTSYLPTGLVAGVTASNFSSTSDNMYYNGILTGPSLFLRAMINSSTNWLTSSSIQTFPSFAPSFGNSGSLAGNTTIVNLILNSGETISIGSNTLTINGSVSGTGTITGSVNSNLVIGGTAGSINFTSGSRILKNLTLNTNATATLGSALDITGGSSSGIVTVNTGATLTTGGNLTLKSNALGTASIAASTGTISGNVTVERYLANRAARGGWRFLSSPVQGQTVSNWMTQFYVTGPGDGTTLGAPNTNGWHTNQANIDFPTSGNDNRRVLTTSIRTYNESTSGNLDLGWSNLTSPSQSLTVGQGFRAYIRGPISGGTGQLGPNANSNVQATVTLSLTGAVNSGDITMPVSATATGAGSTFDGTNDGWNLLGNPYPCAYDWNSASTVKTNIATTIHVFDATANSYKSYNSASGGTLTGGIIPSGAAFFVQATNTGAALTFKEAGKITSTPPIAVHKGAKTDEFTIKYSKDTVENDEFMVKMIAGSTLNKDGYDISKLRNENLNIGSYGTDTMPLALSAIPFVDGETRIKLNVEATQVGTYKFEFKNIENFDEGVSVSLLDKYTNKTTSIKANTVYSFEMGAGENQWGKNRFELILNGKATGVNNTNAAEQVAQMLVYPNPATDALNIDINNANFKNSEIVIYNISGTEVLRSNMTSNSAQLNIETLSAGVYFVKVSNPNGFNKTVKFVK